MVLLLFGAVLFKAQFIIDVVCPNESTRIQTHLGHSQKQDMRRGYGPSLALGYGQKRSASASLPTFKALPVIWILDAAAGSSHCFQMFQIVLTGVWMETFC